MSIFSRLFGGKTRDDSTAATPQAVEYEGFQIFPEPIKEGTQYRVAARIEKDVDGATKQHQLVRADTISDLEEAKATSVRKAKQMIDEQGARLFGV